MPLLPPDVPELVTFADAAPVSCPDPDPNAAVAPAAPDLLSTCCRGSVLPGARLDAPALPAGSVHGHRA